MRIKGTILFFAVGLLTMAGCAAFNQAREDKALSDATPLAPGEASPQDKAGKIADRLGGLPYGAGIVAVPLATLALGWFFSWRRGRKLRLTGLPTSEKPISGAVGKATGVEGLIQHVADVTTGLFEFGKPGSELKRTWKGTALAAGGLALYPLVTHLIGAIQGHEINVNPLFAAPLIGVLMGAEKWLSKVLPLRPELPAPTPATDTPD